MSAFSSRRPRFWYRRSRSLSSVSAQSPKKRRTSVRTKASAGRGPIPIALISSLQNARWVVRHFSPPPMFRIFPIASSQATARAKAVPASAGWMYSKRASGLNSKRMVGSCEYPIRRMGGAAASRRMLHWSRDCRMASSHATLCRPYSSVGETGVSTRSGGSRSCTSPKTPWDDANTSRRAVGEASICAIRLRVASTLTRRASSGALSGSRMAARCTTASDAVQRSADRCRIRDVAPATLHALVESGGRACEPSETRGRRRRPRDLPRATRPPCACRCCPAHPSATPSSSSSTGAAQIRCGELREGGEEELVHARAEVGEGRGVGVAGGAEHAVQGVGGVELPIERQRHATPSARSSSRALRASASA